MNTLTALVVLFCFTLLYTKFESPVNAWCIQHRVGLIALAGFIAWMSFIALLGVLERVLGISMEWAVGILSIWPLIFLCVYAEKPIVGRAVRFASGITAFFLIVSALMEG